MLSDLQNLIPVIAEYFSETAGIGGARRSGFVPTEEGQTLHCVRCSKQRRVLIKANQTGILARLIAQNRDPSDSITDSIPPPTLIAFRCEQCLLKTAGLLFWDMTAPRLALFPESVGGLSTPHTDRVVAHLANEGFMCASVGAYTAAIAMYRAAAEALLKQQGFPTGLLNERIEALAEAIKNGTAPAWAKPKHIEILNELKKLGNVTIHPKDVDALEHLDAELAHTIAAILSYLFDAIFEKPEREKARINNLREIANASS